MKNCLTCGNTFQVRGHNHVKCDVCARLVNLEKMRQWRKDNVVTEEGSGSKTGTYDKNPSFKTGRCSFRRWARERKTQLGVCETCQKDISQASKWEWCGHHIDHNSTNNILENLKVLCKQCHQIEHECWKAFQCS